MRPPGKAERTRLEGVFSRLGQRHDLMKVAPLDLLGVTKKTAKDTGGLDRGGGTGH
jgi:hypothetical protein